MHPLGKQMKDHRNCALARAAGIRFYPVVTRFLKYWLPVGLWMLLVFTASTDIMSSSHTSRFLGPLLHRLFPGLSPDAIETIVYAIRKTAHAMEYAILALLVWRALRQPVPGDLRPMQKRTLWLAWMVAVLYAATDEFHQTFVASRQGQVTDVLIDAAGATGALVLLWLLGTWRCKRTGKR
jgi:VanZ family protein